MSRMLGGRYLLTDLLAGGAGGAATEIWQGVDGASGRPVAVKLLRPPLTADPGLADRLIGARSALGALWHHGIARLLDVVVAEGDIGLVSDLVPGVDLARYLTTNGPLAPAPAAELAVTLAEALATAHRLGIAHGELKPSNVVVPPPEGGTVRVTDFAVASLVRDRERPAPSAYRAPEGSDSEPADVYALGVLIYEMLTGTPWRADFHGVEPDRRLLDLVDRCVEADPAARPDAAAVADRLRELIPELSRLRRRPVDRTGAGLVDQPVGGPAAGVRQRRARPPMTRLAVVAVLAAAAVVGAFAAVKALSPPGEAQTGRRGTASAGPSAVRAPALPATATTATIQGGIEFVRYWFELLGYATATGDTAALVAATNPGCAECQAAIDTIRSSYATGGSLRGGGYVVRFVNNNSFSTLDRSVYDATVDRSPRTTLDPAGVARASLAGLSFTNCILILEWTAGRWRVLQVATPGCVA